MEIGLSAADGTDVAAHLATSSGSVLYSVIVAGTPPRGGERRGQSEPLHLRLMSLARGGERVVVSTECIERLRQREQLEGAACAARCASPRCRRITRLLAVLAITLSELRLQCAQIGAERRRTRIAGQTRDQLARFIQPVRSFEDLRERQARVRIQIARRR